MSHASEAIESRFEDQGDPAEEHGWTWLDNYICTLNIKYCVLCGARDVHTKRHIDRWRLVDNSGRLHLCKSRLLHVNPFD
jgi:hypothetical protein